MTFRPCTMSDLETLRDFSRTNFYETFAHLNTPENMEAYLNEAFDTEKLRGELSNPASFFYFLYADDILAGYLKVNEVPAQSDLQDERSLELERNTFGWAFGKRTKRLLVSTEKMASMKLAPIHL